MLIAKDILIHLFLSLSLNITEGVCGKPASGRKTKAVTGILGLRQKAKLWTDSLKIQTYFLSYEQFIKTDERFINN